MAGNTLFRPEDRLAWYADWLKFLQEREADLRAQLARQEKSARKVEAPPEAGIAFVSDQAQGTSFLAIAFGEQASAGDGTKPPVAAVAEDTAPQAEEEAVVADDQPAPGDNDDSTSDAAQADGASEDAAPVVEEVMTAADDQSTPGSSDEDAVDAATLQKADLAPEPPAVEEEPAPLVDDAPPLSGSPSLPLPPSQTEEDAVAKKPPKSSQEKEDLA